MQTLKVNDQSKVDFQLEYSEAGVIPNNTYLVLQHKTQPMARFVVHLDPITRQATIDFSNPDVIHNLNGEYEIKVRAVPQSIQSGSHEWHVGNIVVELSAGATEYLPPQMKGSIKGKEARHVFAPELTYAPAVISFPVGGLLLALLVVFVYFVRKLGIRYNNWPVTFSGRFHALLFIVCALTVITNVDNLDSTLWTIHIFLVLYETAGPLTNSWDILYFVQQQLGLAIILLYLGRTTLQELGEIDIPVKVAREEIRTEKEEKKTIKVTAAETKTKAKGGKKKQQGLY
eukprot:TRINITY_DN88315_c1_g1_i1.p2 TRINITY_DN88315_c1_g1~~TRINITY_DN88315_c1_g1_i1.p2  ORF type:complete len:287 (-),score=18.93 TRINITY_DN88315_c1_g1_i1:2794-3654(-)